MFLKVQDLVVYQRLCELHSPAQLAERHGDRHVRKRIDAVNNSRDGANETVHHLYIGFRKKYFT